MSAANASRQTDGRRASQLQRAAGLSPGTHVGRYVVLTSVGEGASGVVYAGHDPELDRKIAIKVLHRSAEPGDVDQERLLNEARAMAKLAHPNVVSVYDVGRVGEHMFVAMEFVDGSTLRAWNEQPHTTKEIIDAFLAAGRGLAAAHTAGLIHRDFKPENVLIGKDGRVRVTDFGLACHGRAPTESRPNLAGPDSERGVWTNAMAGTPAYMAPEQSTGAATMRSDQFSFCVSLGEALFGTRPTTAREALNPKGSPRRVPSRLLGVLARGLEEKPDLRFASMTDLVRAIESVESRGRRWLMATGVLAFLGVALWGTAHAFGPKAQLCTEASVGLRGVWDVGTKRDAARAFQATGLVYSGDAWQSASRTMDAYADSWVASRTDACQATRIRGEQSDAVLTLRMQCLDRKRGELKALSDVLVHADAQVVQHAVDAAGHLGPLSACDDTTALTSSVPLPESKNARARVERIHADLDRVRAFQAAGKAAEVLPDARKAALEAKDIHYRPIEAEALYVQGLIETEVGEYKTATTTLYEAVSAAEAGRHDEIAAEVWVALVNVLGSKLDRIADADLCAQRARAAIERVGGSSLASRMLPNALGMVDQEAGNYADAVKQHQTAIDLATKALGADHIQVARSVSKLGTALRDNGELDQALAAYARSLAVEERVLGPNHPDVATTVQSMGVALSRLGRYEEARDRYERAREIRERVLGVNHPLVGESLASLVVAMRWSGAAAEALPLAERAVRIEEATFGADNDSTAGAVNNVGFVHEALGHLAEARQYYEQALHTREKVFGPDSARVGMTLGNVARVVLAQGDASGAIDLYARALRIDEHTLKEDHPDLAFALVGLGQAYLAKRDVAHALPMLERALALRESHHVAPRLLAEARFAHARGLWDSAKDRARAVTLATQAQADYAPLGPAFDAERRNVDGWLRTKQ